ncbi:MAG: serine/threonine protein kinase [Planctomycetes bacterium]|nr:serine/threonine protein kinase [Planctomycetota bacterium]
MAQAFRCPACRHKFVPTTTPADGKLPCPACGQVLRVPIRSPTPAAPGERMLGKYKLGHKLGEGATATVYQATASDGTLVALKVLNEESARDQEFLARFKREAELAQKVSHPNIVGVRGFGFDQGKFFLAMELVEGQSLEEEIERHRKVPWRDACRWCLEVAGALEAASARGIIHRDIKPANIMLAGGKVAKLADLGFGKQIEGSGAWEQLTMSGVAMGSPAYMPPEQVLDAKQADHRSDCYSLGATLYHAVTGRLPFSGRSSQEVMELVLRTEAPAPRTHVPDLPEGVDALIRWAMHKDKHKRPQSAAELAQEIRAVVERPDDAKRFAKRLKPAKGGAPAWVVPVIILLLLLAVAGATVALLRG